MIDGKIELVGKKAKEFKLFSVRKDRFCFRHQNGIELIFKLNSWGCTLRVLDEKSNKKSSYEEVKLTPPENRYLFSTFRAFRDLINVEDDKLKVKNKEERQRLLNLIKLKCNYF